MTQKELLAYVRGLGLTARVVEGEYRVNYRNGLEATAYYTGDVGDARDTALAMALEAVDAAIAGRR